VCAVLWWSALCDRCDFVQGERSERHNPLLASGAADIRAASKQILPGDDFTSEPNLLRPQPMGATQAAVCDMWACPLHE